MKYPVYEVKIEKLEKKYVNDCLNTSWIGQGAYVKNLEIEFSKYVGCKYGISTTSGTTALHLACRTLGIRNGDEVLISSSTNMASAFAVIYCGAIPIPVDINSDTWQMDVSKIESKISKKTKAIMPVHLFGQSVDMDPIIFLAKKYNLKIIEDCAEAIGVLYKKRKIGSIGHISAFSFFANKTITCGEGGMVVTNDKRLALKAYELKNLCYGKKNRFLHSDIGFNYRLPNISAAIALGQLRRIDSIIEKKKRIYQRYFNNLKNIKNIKIPIIDSHTTRFIMWVFNISLINERTDSNFLIKKLKSYSIESRPAFAPINKQPWYKKKYFNFFKKNNCHNANEVMRKGLYLPSGSTLNNSQIDFICEKVINILK